jgi:hypothetical protein
VQTRELLTFYTDIIRFPFGLLLCFYGIYYGFLSFLFCYLKSISNNTCYYFFNYLIINDGHENFTGKKNTEILNIHGNEDVNKRNFSTILL